MENQVEVLETTDVSNDEIDRILADFETGSLSNQSGTPTIAMIASDGVQLRSLSASEAYEEFNEMIREAGTRSDAEEHEEEPAPQPAEPIIPVNSPTLLVEESSSRFSSAIWYDAVRTKSVVLAGVGGIGSYVAFLLSRMKPASLTIYDPDTVEEVNMSGQLYSKKNVGKTKVDSIAEMMADYSNFFNTMSIADKFTENSPAENIMICGFDNMKARNLFFNRWLLHVSNLPEEEKKKCLFIDGRLAAEEFQVFCITGDDRYHQDIYMKEHLFSDAEADETICSYKQTSHCANMIGSIMVNLFVNFVANECEPLIPRDLPFITTYDAERMFFKTSI